MKKKYSLELKIKYEICLNFVVVVWFSKKKPHENYTNIKKIYIINGFLSPLRVCGIFL